MATVPYDQQGPGTVEADTRAPDDLQHIEANPDQFGGLIAKGAQQFGAGASVAGKFFGQMQADQVSNNFQESATKIVDDYKRLQGQDALNAQPGVQKQLDDLLQQNRSQLSTPEEQLQFDNFSRRYRTYLNTDIGTHYDQQYQQHVKSVNSTSADLATQGIARNADNPNAFAASTSDLINARIKQLQFEGNDTPEARQNIVDQSKRDALHIQVATIDASDPNRALGILNANKNIAGDDYARLYDGLKAKADRQVGLQTATQTVNDVKAGIPPATPHNIQGTDDAASMVRGAEGFRPSAYWDVNHWRTGYGSDTVTRADGTVEPVTAFTTVTQADAERDLQRRVQLTQNGIQQQVGPQAWSALSPNARASLTSVGYNYGHLPASVASAVRTGDPGEIAEAIANLRTDNGGVNANRRLQEAENVLGKFGLSGVEATHDQVPSMVMPQGAEGEAPSDLLQTPDQQPSTAAPIPTLPTPQAPPVPQAPPSPKADVYQRILASNISPEAKMEALRAASEQLQAQAIAQAGDEKARKEASDQAMDGYVTRALKNDTQGMVDEIANDPHLLPETKWALGNAVKEHADNGVVQASKNYGSGFWGLYKRIQLPAGDPQRISDPTQLLGHAGDGGDLTLAGVDKLQGIMRSNLRSVDDAAVNQSRTGLIDYARDHLSFDGDQLFPGMAPLKDLKGKQLFEGQFIPKYLAAFDAWVKDGKNPWDPNGPLSQGYVDKMIAGMRPKAQMAIDRVNAESNAAGVTPQPQQIAAAPAGVDQSTWSGIMQRPPMDAKGQPWPATNWARAVEILRADPKPETMAEFDKFAPDGFKAKDILSQLTPAARQ